MVFSIRSKLLVSHFVLVFLGALAFGATGYLLLLRQLESAEAEKLQVIASMAAQETDRFILDRQQLLMRVAEGREVKEFPVTYRSLALLGYLTKFSAPYPELSYWDAEDTVAAAVFSRDVAPSTQVFFDQSLLDSARQRPGEVQVGRSTVLRSGAGLGISMALGIKEYFGDAYVGTLLGQASLHDLIRRLDSIAVGSSGHVVLLDESGSLLTISGLDADFDNLGEGGRALLARFEYFKDGFGRLDFLETDCLAAHAHVPATGWTVAVFLPYEEFAAGPLRLRNQYLLILLGVAACGALLAFLLATGITGPLLNLTIASRAVASGRLEPIPPMSSGDEIGELVDSFNRMIHELQTTTVSRDQLDNILGSMHDALFVVGSDGRVRMANPACYELFGLSRESVSGQPFDDTFGNKLFHFDCFSVLQQLEEQKVFESFFLDDAGRNIPVAISISPLREVGDAARGLIGLIQDISDRKASEEKIHNARSFLETVLNSMGDAISIVDAHNLAIVGANQVFLQRAGRSEIDVLGQKCYTMSLHDCPPDRRTPEQCPVLRCAASGAPASSEYEHRGADGRRIFVEVHTSPIKNDAGEVTSVVHVARDVSARKFAEVELKAFAAKLEQSNRELTDFAYVASHDLQEPLRKVTAFGDRLKSKYHEVLGEQGCDYLERMCHAAVRMQTLIEDLLSFSRVATQTQPFSRVELGEITREVLDDLEIRIQDLHGSVEVGELPAIAADPLQMRQIMQNLIGNALKFHHPGMPPVVRIRGELIDGGKTCRITVADNGIGIEEQYLERIFGVFQRLHGRGEYAGSGVGLAICRKIANRHHGSITVTSVAGEGATFIVTLPVAPAEGETKHG